ncbi:hypothetical protein HGRIS_009552 [Hohenbuehelia grisea]|uniref:Uncharacterized protein n=1 Tax=Hohenbuehelia grisea TaxID=104357 RepID=A0ABR3J1Y3_9AGAR
MLAASQPLSPRAERTPYSPPPGSYATYRPSSQTTIVPLPSPPVSPPRGRRPSVSNAMHWLTRNASSKDAVTPSQSKRASEAKPIRSIDISRPQRNGVLGAGARVVRTPDEALRESCTIERAGVLGAGATVVRTPDEALRDSSVCLTYQHSRSTSTSQLVPQRNASQKRNESPYRVFHRQHEESYFAPADSEDKQVQDTTVPDPFRAPTLVERLEDRPEPARRPTLPEAKQEQPHRPAPLTLREEDRADTAPPVAHVSKQASKFHESSFDYDDEVIDEAESQRTSRSHSPPLPPLPPSEPSSSVYSMSPPRPRNVSISRSPSIQSLRPSLKSTYSSLSQEDVDPVPPLPANVASSPPPPTFRPILVSEVPSGAIDHSKIIVTLETCTTTYRTTVDTLCSRSSRLATYLDTLFTRAKRDHDAASVYSTQSDDMSTYHHHLTGLGLLHQSSFSVHIFLDRPSGPYAHILNYLRSPEDTLECPESLPHAVRLRSSSASRLEALLELRDEANYLGLDALYKLCTDELRLRQSPRLHTRGTSSSSSASLSVHNLASSSVCSLHTLLERTADDARPESGSTCASGYSFGTRSSGDLKSRIKNTVKASVARARTPPPTSKSKTWHQRKSSNASAQFNSPPAGWI